MTTRKKAVAIFSIWFFACYFLALRPPVADVDRSGAVDLCDAIIAVQGLHALSQSGPVEEPATSKYLGPPLLNAVEAFKVLAGLKSFSPQKQGKTISSGAALLALVPTLSVHPMFTTTFVPKIPNSIYSSIALEPSTPPPRT